MGCYVNALSVVLMVYSLLALCLDAAAGSGASTWQGVLDTHRSVGAHMDYAAIKKADATAQTMAWLVGAEPPEGQATRMAFWINAYNALTVDLVADNWPLKSIRDLDEGQVWKTRRFTVAGKTLTLDQIEHEILVPLGDPRVHFALNCAALSCPPLAARAFSGASLGNELDAATRGWIRGEGVRVDQPSKTLHLSKIFDWYAADFAETAGAEIPGVDARLQGVVRFVATQLEGPEARWVRAGGYTVTFMAYDWAVNATAN